MVGNFCCDEFWDLNKTWNNEIPDFTVCFQDVMFVTTPSILFSIIFFVNILFLPNPLMPKSLPWTWLNISKTILSYTLLILSLRQIKTSPHASLLASCSQVILFISIIIIMQRHKTCGVTTSYLLSVFWLVFTLCSVLRHRSLIINYFILSTGSTTQVAFVQETVYYSLIYLQSILSVFADKKKFDILQNSNVIDDVSFFSFITFIWFNRYIYLSTKKFLSICDLGFLSVKLTTRYVYDAFSRNWKFHCYPELLKSQSLLWSLSKSFWPWLVTALICDLVFIVALLLPPILLDRVIDFVSHDYYSWRGYFFALIIFVVDFVGKIIQNNGIFMFLSVGAQMKSAVMNAIFRKNLLLSTLSRKDFTSGNISSLMSIDVERIYYFCWKISLVIVSPLKIILIVVILWQYIGISSLSGVGVIILLFPISFYISRIGGKCYEKHMEVKDTRLKYMNEVLSGIKILKLYAWEISFSKKVSQARKEELKFALYCQLCYVLTSFVFFCAPIMVSIASFATYLLIDRNNFLDPTRAFVSVTLMEQLRYAMFELPDAVSELIQCNIALGRLKDYFKSENMDTSLVGNNPDTGEIVSIRQGSFTWSENLDTTLADISLHLPKGKLVAVIGPVGCGKSSLLSAILGEMYKKTGSIDLKGSIAYVPQQAWILNQTLRDNVLLMKNMIEGKYQRILKYCCLKPDLEILPAGDRTEIGEKGVNLSGGQKQRVSLARAVYQDKDIYLLDDTLSAVDVHVRKKLFDDIISNDGLLKRKTRILVTHDISVLPKVDIIVSMKDGKIEEIGSYQDLINHNGFFTNFIKEHSNEKQLIENSEMNKRQLSRLISSHSNISETSYDEAGGDQKFRESEDFYNYKLFEEKNFGNHVKKDQELKDNEIYRITEDEKMEVGSVNKLIYWNYIKTVGPLLSVLVFVGSMFYSIFETGGNIWLSKWSNDATINGTKDGSSTIWRLEIYGAFGLLQAFSVLIGSFFLMYGTIVTARRYFDRMLDSVLKSPMSFFDCTPAGRIMNRFSSDLDILDFEIADKAEGWINCFFFSIACFYVVGSNVPIFLLSLIPVGIVFYIFQKLHLTTMWQIQRLESITKSPIFSQLLEAIQGVSSINAFSVKEDFIESFEEKLEQHMVCQNSVVALNRWLNFYLDVVGSTIVLIATLLAIANRHVLSPADVGLMITYILSVTNALKWFVRMNTELENRSISVERCEEYSNLKPEASWKLPQEIVPVEWPSEGNILFQNYSTKYRDNLDLVLKEINMFINGGEKVGIVGRTGAGKSSITLALFRIIEPVSGTIFIDDVDISKIGLHTLRSKLTIIPQDPVLFTGSLRSNLDPNDEYNDNALWESLERAHLKEFVSNLVEGLEHSIEESGANLSAGQKQLVCLARALLKNTKILVLDEATASVDIETDQLIQSTIRTAFSNHTVVTIAHRLNTVLDYDKIIVMENGSVIEVGNPANLMKISDSTFNQMCQEAGLT